MDWYDTVGVKTGILRKGGQLLSRTMVDQLLTHWGYLPALNQQIRITLHSTIPVARGAINGTVDVTVIAVATARHLGHPLDKPTLARLRVALEPTDSTLFHQLTLLDHNTAATQITCPPPPALDLLVLGSPLTLRTTDHHQLPHKAGLLASTSQPQLAWEKVQQACHYSSLQLLGEVATTSTTVNRQLLPKPGSDTLLQLVESTRLYGLNVAHSSSVVGLLLNRHRHGVEFLQRRPTESDVTTH